MESKEIHVKTDMKCMSGGEQVRIVEVIAESWRKSNLANLTGVDENGKKYAMADMADSKGLPLQRFEDSNRRHFSEWLRCMCKEEEYRKSGRNFCTEYCYTEAGREYWYNNKDFKMHTEAEG